MYLCIYLFVFLLKIFIYSLTIGYIYTVYLDHINSNSSLHLPSDPPRHMHTLPNFLIYF